MTKRRPPLGNGILPLDEDALTAAHLAVENVLIEFRDRRIGVLNRGNGFVVCEDDGKASSVIRLGTRDGLRIAIEAYLAATVSSRCPPTGDAVPHEAHRD